MDATRYFDLELLIGTLAPVPVNNNAGSNAWPVHVLSSPAGPASGQLEIDLNDEFQEELVRVRSVESDVTLRKSFGSRLFKALFVGDVGKVWSNSYGRVVGSGAAGLRLRLWISVPSVAALPWELLWEEQNNTFLATSASLAVSRYLPVPEPPLLIVDQQLRILLVVESPQGVTAIEDEEINRIKTALQALCKVATYDEIRNPTTKQIQAALQQDEYHVLHFLGHGTAEKLVVTGESGHMQAIEGEEFAQLVLGRRSLRLVVLNACHSGQSEAGGLFAGVGPVLVQKGMPAVVAMQYPFVHVDTASQFSSSFYGAVATGRPVDIAVNEARQYLSTRTDGALADRDWSTPVLYMGTRSGHILNVVGEHASTFERAWLSVQAITEGSVEAEASLAELSRGFHEVAERHRAINRLLALTQYLGDLRDEFAACADLVQQSGGDWRQLAPRLVEVSQAWHGVRQEGLIPLESFVARHPDVDTVPWTPTIVAQAALIETHINDGAPGPVLNAMTAFADQVSRAEVDARQRLEDAILDLLAFSERTLGHLNVTPKPEARPPTAAELELRVTG